MRFCKAHPKTSWEDLIYFDKTELQSDFSSFMLEYKHRAMTLTHYTVKSRISHGTVNNATHGAQRARGYAIIHPLIFMLHLCKDFAVMIMIIVSCIMIVIVLLHDHKNNTSEVLVTVCGLINAHAKLEPVKVRIAHLHALMN